MNSEIDESLDIAIGPGQIAELIRAQLVNTVTFPEFKVNRILSRW